MDAAENWRVTVDRAENTFEAVAGAARWGDGEDTLWRHGDIVGYEPGSSTPEYDVFDDDDSELDIHHRDPEDDEEAEAGDTFGYEPAVPSPEYEDSELDIHHRDPEDDEEAEAGDIAGYEPASPSPEYGDYEHAIQHGGPAARVIRRINGETGRVETELVFRFNDGDADGRRSRRLRFAVRAILGPQVDTLPHLELMRYISYIDYSLRVLGGWEE